MQKRREELKQRRREVSAGNHKETSINKRGGKIERQGKRDINVKKLTEKVLREIEQKGIL